MRKHLAVVEGKSSQLLKKNFNRTRCRTELLSLIQTKQDGKMNVILITFLSLIPIKLTEVVQNMSLFESEGLGCYWQRSDSGWLSIHVKIFSIIQRSVVMHATELKEHENTDSECKNVNFLWFGCWKSTILDAKPKHVVPKPKPLQTQKLDRRMWFNV